MEVINKLKQEQFISLFSNIVEHTPQVAEIMYKSGPFSSRDDFLSCIDNILLGQDINKVEILMKYPDLAGKLCQQGLLTAESKKEHSSAGLTNITAEQRSLLTELNNNYRSKFGFPFVVCARENKLDSILTGLDKRYGNTSEEEITAGIGMETLVKKRLLLV